MTKGMNQIARRQHKSLMRYLTGFILLSSQSAIAREYYFNPTDLEGDAQLHQNVDLSLFSNNKAQLPGRYHSIVRMNTSQVDELSISYKNGPDGALQPDLTPALLRKWGVRVDAYPTLAALPANQPLTQPLGVYIPAAQAGFDFSQMTLDISMPQVAINNAVHGNVDPSLWDNGVPVLFTDYSFSGSQMAGSGTEDTTNQYLNLRSGLNLGGWRLRNYSTWSKSDDEQSWDALQTFIQHDVQSLKAQFTAGESSTRGDVFDSLQYRGVNLASDEEMLPYSMRGFAPIIRGIANSNAEVSVRQNGYLIYQATVAPGAFELKDLYSTSNSGDFDVTIKEADGTEHKFTQPYSSVPLMQRPDQLKFELTAGKYRANETDGENEPEFFHSSGIYGLNNFLTVYGGLLGSKDYYSVASGLGMALGPIGALSTDVTWAHAKLDNGTESDGQSLRLQYSKSIEVTYTNFSLASYRYSSSGYYSFADANQKYDETDADDYWSFNNNKRTRIQLNINQTILASSLYLNGYQQDFWGSRKKERSLSAGFNTQVNGISLHVAYSYNKTADNPDDRMVSFGFSVPLSRWLPNSWASYNISNSKHGDTSQHLGLSGTLLDDQRLSYSLLQSHTNHDGTDSSSIYGSYFSQYANLNAGYYYSADDTQQLSYGISGAIVAHPHGVTLSQPLGNEFAIIDANGASGIHFQNQRGIQTDHFGNAIIPSLSAYQENRIGLDTTTLPEDVDTSDTAITVVPTRNAAVIAHFDAYKGYRVLATLLNEDGKHVPYGAIAIVDEQAQSNIIDENGTVYLAGVADSTSVTVRWGDKTSQQCRAVIILPEIERQTDNPTGLRFVRATCHKEQSDAVK